jgi:KaiC/GvpD/RAD55 family RecA-like ATPase
MNEFRAAMVMQYVNKGRKVIPLQGKVRITKQGDVIDMTKYDYDVYNVGLLTGSDNNLIVVDCDGEEAEVKYKELGLPETLISKTPHGYHHFFAIPKDMVVKNAQDIMRTKDKGFAIDIRGEGGYVAIPPSDGYGWHNNARIALFPPKLGDLLMDTAPKSGIATLTKGAPKGERHTAAMTLAGTLLKKGIRDSVYYDLMRGWNQLNDPPLDEQELIDILNRIRNSEETKGVANDGVFSPMTHMATYKRYLSAKSEVKEPCIKTGFPALDSMIWGLNPGELHVVMADSNVGKTALMLYMAFHNAKAGKRVLYFSTESSRHSVLNRVFSTNYGIMAKSFRTGLFTEQESSLLNEQAYKEIEQYPFYVCDKPEPGMKDIQELTQKYNPDVLFVDYFQRCCFTGENWVEYKKAAIQFKNIAREHNIPVVVASQVNSPQKFRDFKTGKITQNEIDSGDGRSSKTIKHEADIVIVLNKKKSDVGDEFISLRVDKSRDTEKGNLYFKFISEYLRFEQCQEIDYKSL